MGLDWFAFTEEVNQESWRSEYFQSGYYRGKGVSYDENICKYLVNVDDCYGTSADRKDICGHIRMKTNQKWNIVRAIDTAFKLPEDEIVLEDETYEEWREWMEGAREFLASNEFIFCWY
jgi:hypothetical protein